MSSPTVRPSRSNSVAVRDLLGQAADHPTLEKVLFEGAALFGEIAAWNQLVVQQQTERGRVMVPGRFLSGNEVSDDPMLVRAKLKNHLAPVPPGHLQPLTEACRSAEAASRRVARTACSAPVLSL